MPQSTSRTLAHWRIEPGFDIFDICTRAEPGTLHCHPTYNFGCVLGGAAQLDIGGKTIPQPMGSVVLLNAFDAHASTWLERENRYFVIYANDDAWSELLDRTHAHESLRFTEPVTDDNILFHMLRGIWLELQARPANVGLADIASLLQLCISRGKAREHDSAPRDMLEAQAILQNLSSALTAETAEGAIRVEDVATQLGMSRFQLSRLCLANHGMQPRRLKLQLMVARAQLEISQGASLTDAALAAGFSDQSHMSREFRKTIGMTPREYQDVITPLPRD